MFVAVLFIIPQNKNYPNVLQLGKAHMLTHHTEEHPQIVRRNIKYVSKALAIAPNNLHTVHDFHSKAQVNSEQRARVNRKKA